MTFADQRKMFLKTALVIFLLGTAGIYGYFKMKNLIEGPMISVHFPVDGGAFSESLLEVEGLAENISFLSLNDRRIFVDGDGKFREEIALLPGYNILSLKGEDKFGKKTEKLVRVVLKE